MVEVLAGLEQRDFVDLDDEIEARDFVYEMNGLD